MTGGIFLLTPISKFCASVPFLSLPPSPALLHAHPIRAILRLALSTSHRGGFARIE